MLARAAELNDLIKSRAADILSFESRLQSHARENESAIEKIEEQRQRRVELENEIVRLTAERTEQLANIHSEES